MATRIWTNSTGDNDLATAANYDAATVPVSGDELLFSFRSSGPPTKNMDQFTGTKATETLTLSANMSDGDTVTIGTTVYRIKSTMAQAFDVQLGGSADATIDSLVSAVLFTSGGEGVDYFAGTTIHPDVTAVNGTGDVMDITAKIGGTAANSIVTTETSGTASWGDTSMSGGTDFTLASLYVGQDCIVNVGETSNPLHCNIITKAVHQGNSQMHLRADTITRAICNSEHLGTVGGPDEFAMSIDNTTTLTALVADQGRISIGSNVTTVTRILVSFRDSKIADVFLVVGESTSAIAEFRQVGGEVILNRLPTLGSVEDGVLTIMENAPANTVTLIEMMGSALVNYNNTQTITRVNVFDGIFDTTDRTNKLTITNISVWPGGTFLRSDDLVTYGGGAVLVDLTGGDV